ncbi:class I SAM-dependent methyltransferase [Brevundimonas sp.]|uniref:class I SAM-dependent methyltransferase n=1 Tax=Brevundimonas sp. TaxID=1871086 RepID=UPI0035B35880
MKAKIVQLSSVAMTPMALKIRAQRDARWGEAVARKNFPDYEWQRLSYVGRRLKGSPSLLEVGPGRGFLSRMIAKGGRYARHEVVDVAEAPNNVAGKFGPKVVYRRQSVTDLTDADGAFDTVLCTNVLERLDDEELARALDQLRRVCARRLIITLPFAQPLPLPDYLHQRFDTETLEALFPTGAFTLLFKEPVTRVPWVVIEEHKAVA